MGFCEHGKVSLGFIKDGEFIDKLNGLLSDSQGQCSLGIFNLVG